MIISPSDNEKVENEPKANLEFNVANTEKQLEDILSKIDGVGRVDVMLTVSESSKNVYAKNINESEVDKQSEVVLVSKSGQDGPITIKNVYPEFMGALIVCDGADDPKVNLTMLEAIKSLCDITSDKITITKMKK